MPPTGPRQSQDKRFGKKSKPKNTKKTAKRLLGYLKDSKAKISAAFVCVILSSASTLTGSYLLKPIMNNLTSQATAQEKIKQLAIGLIIMMCVYFVGIIATYVQARVMVGVSQRTLNKIRSDLFNKLQKLPVRYFDQNATGDIMSRFTNDIDNVGNMLSSTLISVFPIASERVWTAARLTALYSTLVGFLKPNFGRRRWIGIWPPSKPILWE